VRFLSLEVVLEFDEAIAVYDPPGACYSAQISAALHAHPRPLWHDFLRLMQLSPHACPLSQTAQHWLAGMHVCAAKASGSTWFGPRKQVQTANPRQTMRTASPMSDRRLAAGDTQERAGRYAEPKRRAAKHRQVKYTCEG